MREHMREHYKDNIRMEGQCKKDAERTSSGQYPVRAFFRIDASASPGIRRIGAQSETQVNSK